MKKGLAAVIAALLALQCMTAFAAEGWTETFSGKTGSALVDGWTLQDCVETTEGRYVNDPSEAGNTVLEFVGTGTKWSPMIMKKTYATPVAVPGSGKMTISYRIRFAQDNAAGFNGEIYGCGIAIGQGSSAVANLAVTKIYSRGMFFLNQNIYSSAQIGNALSEPFLCPSSPSSKDPAVINYHTPFNTWLYVKLECDFNAKTIDVYGSSGTPVADDAVPFCENMPFVEGNPDITAIDTVTVSGSSDKKNVSTMIDDISIVPVAEEEPAPDVTVAAAGVSAQANGETATLRFNSKVVGEGATGAGAAVLPLWIFEQPSEEIETSTQAAAVSINQAVADGETFGIDVTDIPASQFGTVVVVKPYVMVGGVQNWAAETAQSSVDVAVTSVR